MRAFALAYVLTSAHADNTTPESDPGRLLANACRLLRAKTAAPELLRQIGAVDVRDAKDGWWGNIPNSLFGRVTPEIPQSLMFFARLRLSHEELQSMTAGLKCVFEGPMRFDEERYSVLMSLHRRGPH
jgi:hypothetical protein